MFLRHFSMLKCLADSRAQQSDEVNKAQKSPPETEGGRHGPANEAPIAENAAIGASIKCTIDQNPADR